MNSIDNLREYVLTAPGICSTTKAILVGYVDEIEREVRELTDERDLLKTQWEAGVDFDQRLEAAAVERADVTLFGVDYTPLDLVKEHLANRCMTLPLDADGVPIHVGDVVAATLAHGGSGRWVVDRMELTRAYDQDLWQIALDKDGACWVTPSTVRHHHAPTVEDVLREFGKRWDDPAHYAKGELVEEFAEKLRLAGEDA